MPCRAYLKHALRVHIHMCTMKYTRNEREESLHTYMCVYICVCVCVKGDGWMDVDERTDRQITMETEICIHIREREKRERWTVGKNSQKLQTNQF